ncbi:MAG: hypothetical protein Q7S87_10200 [Agitococcus sp.]|nr:hypothetical protein [Agitococcus sp.]MDO9179301.1 hypothetical protein [Agitococcus sp.]
MTRLCHLEVIEKEANESDTEGYSYVACNAETNGNTSTDMAFVTCKACRHWHAVDHHSTHEFERTY